MSVLYAVNSTGQLLAENSQVPFGSVVRRCGCDCQLDGDSITLRGTGYYDVDISLSTVPSAEGDISIQLYKDGIAVQGATATVTAAAGGDAVNLHVNCVVRNCCCNSTLSVYATAAHTPINMATVVRG